MASADNPVKGAPCSLMRFAVCRRLNFSNQGIDHRIFDTGPVIGAFRVG